MEVRTRIAFVMPTEKDYKLMAHLAGLMFVSEDSWTVEQYDEKFRRIEFEEALATEDDAIEMVDIINQWMKERPAGETRDILMGIEFKVEGTTTYCSSGEQFDYIIEKKEGKTTIQETEIYYYFGFGYFEDYDEFCETLEGICEDPQKLLPEDEFDPDHDYAVTSSKIYVDETPEYGAKRVI